MKPKILITRQVFPEMVAQLEQVASVDHNHTDDIFSPDTLRARAQGCTGVVTCLTEKIDAAFFDACPTVKVVSNIAVGYNNIDVAEASKRGVKVTNTPGVLDDTTADLTFALLMAAARRVTETERRLRNGEWKKGFALQQWLGTDIHHASLGIIGMGRIGQTIAKRASGFEMKVSYFNRTRLDAATEEKYKVAYKTKEAILRDSDFVVVMVPYSAATHHLIKAEDLALMKPSAILINTARGGVVDDVALIAALKEKRIAGAGIDVFEGEPALNPAFLDLDNVALTPHIGSATHATRMRMAMLAATNMQAALEGREPPNWINRS
ncbi:MAG: D-glycerate dehydrogenase [Betaproteobacteria bacterium]|nr:D-glycerate dehydrogenase [Betaproteobacteria bacterium]